MCALQDQLHATFRCVSPVGHWPGQLPALALLQWEVAVVMDTNPADPDHRCIRIKDHERFMLQRR